MAEIFQQRDQSLPAEIEGSTTDIHLPEGFELADYTLRRVHDGQLQTYVLDNDHSRLVQAVPISAQPSVTQMEGDDQIDQSDPGSDSSTPVPATNNSSHQTQPPHQQLFTIPIPSARPSNRAKAPSSCTQKRHAFSRNDGYTIICGMNSPAKATPVKKINPGKGKFRCPRCGSNFTRPKSVKDHFPDCVLKCGNPEGLRYTDHPSMAKAEANLQHRGQASHEASDSAMEDEQEEEEKEEEGNDDDEKMEWEDEQMRADDQATRFEEMDDTPASTSPHRMQRDQPDDGDPHVKTEFVFGADIAQESTETTIPERQFKSIKLEAHESSRPSTSSRSEAYTPQTPDWQTAWRRSPHSGPSTPKGPPNEWNIGIAGSDAEYVQMNMRVTAPFEGHPSEAQIPMLTSPDGLQHDSLDDFMERRSQVSATPDAPTLSPTYSDIVDWDGGMVE